MPIARERTRETCRNVSSRPFHRSSHRQPLRSTAAIAVASMNTRVPLCADRVTNPCRYSVSVEIRKPAVTAEAGRCRYRLFVKHAVFSAGRRNTRDDNNNNNIMIANERAPRDSDVVWSAVGRRERFLKFFCFEFFLFFFISVVDRPRPGPTEVRIRGVPPPTPRRFINRTAFPS